MVLDIKIINYCIIIVTSISGMSNLSDLPSEMIVEIIRHIPLDSRVLILTVNKIIYNSVRVLVTPVDTIHELIEKAREGDVLSLTASPIDRYGGLMNKACKYGHINTFKYLYPKVEHRYLYIYWFSLCIL